MHRFLLILLVATSIFTMTGCSVAKDILGEEKYNELTDKINAAWDRVGKDAIGDLTDDAWREFGFGKSLDWPGDGVGATLPKFRNAHVNSCISDKESGHISLSAVSDSDIDEYLQKLYGIGYEKAPQSAPFDTVVVFDGTYVGFVRLGKSDCALVFAPSLEKLEKLANIDEN